MIKGLGNTPTKVQIVANNGLALAFPLTVSPVLVAPFDMAGAGFTIETWIYVNAYDNPSNSFFTGSEQSQMLVLGKASAYSMYWRLTVVAGKGYLEYFSYNEGLILRVSRGIDVETWTHIRVTYTAATNELTMHVNNLLAGSALFQATHLPTTGFNLGHIDSNRNSNNFYGLMDEFRWWRYPRTAFENTSSWRLKNKDVLGINSQSMCCCYSFEDSNQLYASANYMDGSGNGLYLQDSYNSSGGVQRGSSAPFLASGNATGLLATT